MSRRDKQADLRRRMAEARSKLVSSNTNASELDEIAETDTSSSSVSKKRPLPSSSSGGGGGILRKPKYTQAVVATSDSATTDPLPTKNSTISKKDKEETVNSSLGALMADYNSSSEDEDADKGNNNAKVAAPYSTSTNDGNYSVSKNNDHIQNETVINEQIPTKKKKKKKKKKKTQVVETKDDISMHMKSDVQGLDTINNETLQFKGVEECENGKSNDTTAGVSDDVLNEFYALLDDDGEKEALLKDNEHLKSEEINNRTIPIDDKVTKKKSKKKKKNKETKKKNMYDNDDMNNIEQASYEARLGRLMLLKSKKTHTTKSVGTNDDNDALLSSSTNEFYNGGLAFQQEEEEEEEEEDERPIDDSMTNILKSDGGSEEVADATTSSEAALSSISAPRVSLAKILRDRRDQARQLSRGNNNNETKDDGGLAEDNEEDGRWF